MSGPFFSRAWQAVQWASRTGLARRYQLNGTAPSATSVCRSEGAAPQGQWRLAGPFGSGVGRLVAAGAVHRLAGMDVGLRPHRSHGQAAPVEKLEIDRFRDRGLEVDAAVGLDRDDAQRHAGQALAAVPLLRIVHLGAKFGNDLDDAQPFDLCAGGQGHVAVAHVCDADGGGRGTRAGTFPLPRAGGNDRRRRAGNQRDRVHDAVSLDRKRADRTDEAPCCRSGPAIPGPDDTCRGSNSRSAARRRRSRPRRRDTIPRAR